MPSVSTHRSVALALLIGLLLAPTLASAHARVVRSTPKNKAVVQAPPPRVELWFNELLDEGFNSIEVFPASDLTAAKRGSVTSGKAEVDAKDRTHLSIELQPLAPGDYVIEWRVLSRDGHSAPGRLTFKVQAAP